MDTESLLPKRKKFRHRKYGIPAIITITITITIYVWPNIPTFRPSNLVPGPAASICAQKKDSLEGRVAFAAVSGTKTLLLSAYMEHRKERQIRVISVVKRSEDQNYHCRMCCNKKLYYSDGVADIHSDYFGFPYGTADIMCPLPTGCRTPSHITVSAHHSDLNNPVVLEVKNQKAESVALPYNFTVCISTMFNFTNVLQLVQSLEMMQLLGVNRVVIYKSDCSNETQRVLDYYTEKGLVEVIPWTISEHLNPSHSWKPDLSPGDIHYYGQIPALNDCVYRYMYKSRYVSLQDIDELILPQFVDSWSELLPQLEKDYGVDKCYMFENNVFPHTIMAPLTATQKQLLESSRWKNVPGVNILAHLHHEPISIQNEYNNYKVIVNPRAVYRTSVHDMLDSENGCTWVDRNVARMYHTRAAIQDLKPEKLIYDDRLLKYSDRLIPAVNTVLIETKFLKPFLSSGKKVAFMTVSGTKTLLLSAYMEHRKERKIRVISIVRRSEDQNYYCHMWCNEKLYSSKGVSDVYSNHFGYSYGTADIMCPLPKGCETPSHITVTDNVPVSDLHELEYLEVKNQKEESVALPYNFTVCISTMYDFTNVLQLVQGLEMMRLLGVNRVAIYKSSCSNETQRVLDYYTEKGLVEVIPWTISEHLKVSHGWQPARNPGDIQYYGQIPALNDCVYRYMYQSRYVSLQDIDELIVPQSVDSWSELLPQLEKKYGVDKCYIFQNNLFPHTIKAPLTTSQKQLLESSRWKNVPGVDILVHLYQRPITKQYANINYKVIVNPRADFRSTVHGLLDSTNGCSWVDRNIARMYHTRAWTPTPSMKPEELVYDGRLLKYSDRLTSAVNTVLIETKFLSVSTEPCQICLKKTETFMAVSGTNTLLLSAYMEHRKVRQIRVISVAKRSEDQIYHCHMCCNETLYSSKGVGNIHLDHFDFTYGATDIMCPLPKGCETPTHITITDNVPVSGLHELKYLEVKNQNAKSDALPYNFTVCISTMYDFTNVLQLVQSLEMMQLLGVDRVVIYKSSCSNETQRVLDYYTEKGLVEVIPWTISEHLNPSHSWRPDLSPGDIHYYGQIPALNDCVYRYMYQSRYVSLQDIDELILPQSVDSWSELLPQLEKEYGVDKCYNFQNNLFPHTIMAPLTASQKQLLESSRWKNVTGVDILVHLYQRPVTRENEHLNNKVIVNPRVVYRTSVHDMLDSEKGCAWVDRDIARLYHTRPWTPSPGMNPEELLYDGRLLKYSDRLIPAVNAVFQKTGCLPSEVKPG